MLEEIIQRFLSASEEDSALKDLAKKRSINLHYVISDAGIEFYMLFRGGEVRTGMGAPPNPGAFTLTMSEETFKGVMEGKIEGMSAALGGKLKFKGDPMKAMALQKINDDLNRLYLGALKP